MEPDYFKILTSSSPESLSSFLHTKLARRMLLTFIRNIGDANRDHPDVKKLQPWTLVLMQDSSDQAKKASKPRGKLESGATIRGLVEKLVANPENHDLTPSELWPKFFAVLNEENCRPKEVSNVKNRKVSYYTYEWSGAGRRKMMFVSFSNLIRAIKRRKTY